MPIKVADETWIGTALLHYEHPDRKDFSVHEIVDRVAQEALHQPLRPGVQVHATLHCVANKRPNPGNYRMLTETGRGRRRLYRHTDEVHPYRQGKIVPDQQDIPSKYHFLINWYQRVFDRADEEIADTSARI